MIAHQFNFYSPGEVVLIGAGPGDPELLTLKAVKYLNAAEVVLVDDLVNPEILSHVNRNARIIHVGKRGGCQSTPQIFIEKMMLNAAKSGFRVVRLKGGDPLMFGRAGEELAAMHRHQIKTTIVNGISSGFAAANALGMSLTHRDYAQGVIFVTGHFKDESCQPNWKLLAESGMTLVVYMGLSRADQLQHSLIQAGMNATTPVGLIESASTLKQKLVSCQLSNMHSAIDQHELSSPVIMIIGAAMHAAHCIDALELVA